jgi:hypothetical protein
VSMCIIFFLLGLMIGQILVYRIRDIFSSQMMSKFIKKSKFSFVIRLNMLNFSKYFSFIEIYRTLICLATDLLFFLLYFPNQIISKSAWSTRIKWLHSYFLKQLIKLMINKQNTKMKTPLFGTSLIYRHNVLFYGYFIISEIVIRLDQSIVYKQFNLNCPVCSTVK